MSPSHVSPLQPIEILLVDDDEADVRLTRRALENDRLINRVHVARDGVEAMRFLRRQDPFTNVPRPDIIFLDLNMPRMDGREALQAIKSDPDLSAIPVIVLTVSDAEEDIARSYAECANSYISKPVDLEQFKRAILAVKEYWFAVVKLPPKS